MARLFTIVSSSSIVVVVFLLLLSDVSLAQTATKEATNANVTRLCADTPYPELCASMITRYDASRQHADDPKLVGMAALSSSTYLLEASGDASPSVQRSRHPGLSKDATVCFETCYKEMTKAGETLDKLCVSKEGWDSIGMAQLPAIHGFIKENKDAHLEYNCDKCRQGDDKKISDYVSKNNDAEKAMAVLEVLVNKVVK